MYSIECQYQNIVIIATKSIDWVEFVVPYSSMENKQARFLRCRFQIDMPEGHLKNGGDWLDLEGGGAKD